ncbi:MAG: oligosaccharide flippase family protein [Bacteroidales bacterium]|nr:oligosaccharide flippase family protein [Bacteroidales bacterium]
MNAKWKINNETIRHCATLLSGTAMAQGITFLAYPVIARLYSAAQFGAYTTLLSWLDVFVILATCRYEQAIMLTSSVRDTSAVVKLCKSLCALVSTMVAIGIIVLLFTRGENSTISWEFMFLPLLVFFTGQYRIYLLLSNKHKGYKQISLSEIVVSISTTTGKICGGLLKMFRIGLPLATLLGRILGNVCYWRSLRKLALPKVSNAEVKAAAINYRNFPLYSTPKDFINSLSINLPFTLLAIYFEQSFIGLFSMAFTFTFRPVNLLNSAYERVLYQRVAEKYNNKQPIMKDVLRFFAYNYLALIPLFALLYIFAEPLMALLLGKEWSDVAIYFRYMLPWALVMVAGSSLSFIPNIFSVQRTEAILYFILFPIRAGVLFIGVAFDNFSLAIALFCGAGALFVFGLTAWYFSLLRRYDRNLKTPLSTPTI